MASAKFPRSEFEKYIKLDKKVEERISMMGTHLEAANDSEIELEILPNCPDLFSLQGFMRSFLPFLGKKSKRDYKTKKSDYKIIVDSSVSKIRQYSMAAVVKNIKFADDKIKDVMQWQEKIHATLGRNRKKVAIGYYILDEIKWPVRYLALEPQKIVFEPLDMPEKINALQILQRHPTGREFSKQMEGLDKFPVYIDSNNEVLSMPPVINSNSLGKITPETRNILIECSGTDLETLKRTISMAVCDLIDCGGEAYSVEIIYGTKKEAVNFQPEKMKIDLNEMNNLLGLELTEKEFKSLAEKMGYEYSNKLVLIPPYRTDIMHPVDVYEDIAIAYGYENFTPDIPQVASIAKENPKEIKRRKVSEILAGLGMLESSSLHLLTKEDLEKAGAKNLIEVEDSKTDFKFLRNNMLTSSLKILSANSDAEYPQRIFEIGRVFLKDEKEETGIKETSKLAISLAPGNFTEIKQILEYLGRMLDKELKIQEASDSRFIEGRVGKIIYSGKEIGVMGEISPQTLASWKIKMPVASLELNADELID